MILSEKITAAWWLMSTVAVLACWRWLADPAGMLLTHGKIAVLMTLSYYTGRWLMQRTDLGLLLRVGTPLAMLVWWYSETYDFCSTMPYLDHWFARADEWLFGGQACLHFAAALPSKAWSEAMNLGYYSFFPLQAAVLLYYYARRRHEFELAGFVILASFLLFYLVYSTLPVAGPQFYFDAIGTDCAARGVFPEVGRYFATHRDMLTPPGDPDGFFYQIVKNGQARGEFPTAAFPSSHIGCTVVYMLLAWRASRRLFAAMLPVCVLLALSTVYIQAHYVIDTFAGLLCGAAMYYFLKKWGKRLASSDF